MRKKKGSRSAEEPAGRITPQDVQDVEFRLAFRGYDERDVDAFLDRVTEDLASYLEELERLRAAATAPAGTASAEEAERILAEARREADRLVEDARRVE